MKQFAVLIFLFSTSIMANPLDRLSLVGKSEMNWMFWKIYSIALYSDNGRYNNIQPPLALSITYAREIDAQVLIDTTIEQWQNLSIAYNPEWANRLKAIWPSVKADDELVFMVNESNTNQFYFNGELIGEFIDTAFSQAFLAIWLSPDTQEPEIRKVLIGEKNA